MARKGKSRGKKLLFSKDTSPCYFCKKPTQYGMDEKDGSQVWACFNCMWEQGKISKFSPSRLKATINKEKSKKGSVLSIKKSKDGYVGGGMR